MKSINEIQKILQQEKPIFKNQFNVEKIGIFGSFVKNKQTEDSDIDILVEFSRPVGFFAFLELEEYLKKKLEIDVDLVTRNSLKPAIGKQILNELLLI